MRGGKLFLFQSVPLDAGDGDFQERVHVVEHFWLCRECASSMTVVSQDGGSPTVVPLLAQREQERIEG